MAKRQRRLNVEEVIEGSKILLKARSTLENWTVNTATGMSR